MNTLTQVFDWLLAASFRASLLTLAVLLTQAALHRHLTARMRYALWLPVFLVLLMPVFPQSRWSVEHFFQPPPQPAVAPLIPRTMTPVVEASPVVHEASAAMADPIDWRRILLFAWLSVSAAMLVFGGVSFILTLRRFTQARHPASDELLATLAQIASEMHLRHVPRVLIASTVSSPAVTGLLRPTLLLPAEFDREFTPAEARLVLRHELMHLKRGDLPLNALMCVLMALHWFNPLLWIAFFKIRADREAACDAQVLQDATHDHRIAYGHALLKVETTFSPRGLSLGFVGIFQRGSALRSRIQFIATHRRPHPAMKLLTSLCVMLMTFLGITRAQQPRPAESAPLIAIEVKIVEFKKPTDWIFGGKLPAEETLSFIQEEVSQETLSELLRDLIKNENTNITSYPRMVTADKNELVVKSIVNTPFKGGYLPIGLVCKFTPAQHGEKIKLDIDITDSDLIDPATGAVVSEFKGDYPTARSRVYRGSHEIRDGHACVIAGWENGKPGSKMPLIYLITPHVIDPKQGGLPADASPATGLTIGKSAFRPGDSIVITSMSRSDNMLTVGFDYELASTDEAVAGLYFTTTSTDGKSPPFNAMQNTPLRRGRGSVILRHRLPAEGLPHVTLYDAKTHASIGDVYFGNATEAAKSQSLDLNYMNASAQASTPNLSEFIKAKLNKIIIPRVHFQRATVEEALEYLRIKTREFDTSDSASRGVSIIYRESTPPSKAAISLDLKDVPLGEALRYIVELAELQMSVQPYAVVIAQKMTFGADLPFPNPVAIPPSRHVVIPSIDFHDATLAECLDYIRIQSRELDPQKKGVIVIFKPGGDRKARISLSLKEVPVYEALRYCAQLSGHKLTYNDRTYSIEPVTAAEPEIKEQTVNKKPLNEAELKASELRKASPQQYDFAKAMLGDVLRFLATEARINFISLPDDNPASQKLVTFSIRSSPFAVLETLCKANGLALVLDQERWLILPSDDTALVERTYALPQTQADVETILKDIDALLGGEKAAPMTDAVESRVTYSKEQNAFSVRATRGQHSWVTGYFRGLAGAARAGTTK